MPASLSGLLGAAIALGRYSTIPSPRDARGRKRYRGKAKRRRDPAAERACRKAARAARKASAHRRGAGKRKQ